MNNSRDPKYWGLPEAERLTATTKDEAIEEILDCLGEDPETIEVCGYAPMEMEGLTGTLERILESLDEEYGDPDGNPTEPTETMKEAEAAFLAVIEREYVVWACDEVCRETVNVAEWRKDTA
jgi:hypothetical protein